MCERVISSGSYLLSMMLYITMLPSSDSYLGERTGQLVTQSTSHQMMVNRLIYRAVSTPCEMKLGFKKLFDSDVKNTVGPHNSYVYTRNCPCMLHAVNIHT